jgi:hypothetical protein
MSVVALLRSRSLSAETKSGLTMTRRLNAAAGDSSFVRGRARPGHPRCAEHVQQLGGASPLIHRGGEKD